MTVINIGDVIEVVQTWDTPLASLAQNVWHLIMDSGAGANSDVVAAGILTNQQVAFAEIEDSINLEFEATLLELRLWDTTLKRFDGVETLPMTGVVGVSAVDFLPHGVAALGRIITENARRQGGTFVPGLQDGAVADGVLTVSAEANLAGYLALFDTDIAVTGGVFQWCTWNVDPLSVLFETESRARQSVIANSLPSYLSKRKPGNGL